MLYNPSVLAPHGHLGLIWLLGSNLKTNKISKVRNKIRCKKVDLNKCLADLKNLWYGVFPTGSLPLLGPLTIGLVRYQEIQIGFLIKDLQGCLVLVKDLRRTGDAQLSKPSKWHDVMTLLPQEDTQVLRRESRFILDDELLSSRAALDEDFGQLISPVQINTFDFLQQQVGGVDGADVQEESEYIQHVDVAPPSHEALSSATEQYLILPPAPLSVSSDRALDEPSHLRDRSGTNLEPLDVSLLPDFHSIHSIPAAHEPSPTISLELESVTSEISGTKQKPKVLKRLQSDDQGRLCVTNMDQLRNMKEYRRYPFVYAMKRSLAQHKYYLEQLCREEYDAGQSTTGLRPFRRASRPSVQRAPEQPQDVRPRSPASVDDGPYYQDNQPPLAMDLSAFPQHPGPEDECLVDIQPEEVALCESLLDPNYWQKKIACREHRLFSHKLLDDAGDLVTKRHAALAFCVLLNMQASGSVGSHQEHFWGEIRLDFVL